ncbi:MAG: GNAT family N-acetyltransferase [Candidatus Levybacteria bacterium]|nr:GNAT family N-acetyltransferase [Candidatus Levybacteria bacterium]
MHRWIKLQRQSLLVNIFRICDFTVGAISLDQKKKLFMRRANLDDLPALPHLPKDYELRVATVHDAKAIAEILKTAYSPFWPAFRARYILLDAEDVKRTFIVTFNNKPIATASARLVPKLYPGSGYVHWVAVHPDHQGKRLGYVVSLAVLHFFKEIGCRDAVLETEQSRLPAINLYTKLGFLPEYVYPSQKELWANVLAKA